jgi:23S rRNA (uracil1939-C5)-methyltransferase
MNSTFDIELTTDSFGGDCVGRLPDGRAVFVPFGIVGERVRIELTTEKRNFARGRITAILDHSPLRIQPRCRHFTDCGGCHYQHLEYTDQLRIKQGIVIQQLERIGKIANPPVQPIVPSPQEWNYRNTVQFHLSTGGKLGYQRAGRAGVLEIMECHLPQEPINALWPQLELDPATGIDRVSIRLGEEDELLLGLESRSSQVPEFEIDFPLSVVFMGAEDKVLLSGEDFSTIRVLDRDFRVSADAFFQVNTAMAEKMVTHVLHMLAGKTFEHIVDAYCGAGLFSAFLAPRCKQLTGIELSESACNDYAANMEEYDHVALYVGAVEQVLPALEIKPDLVLLDPPRAGLDPYALAGLIKAEPGQIIYISCDPATLARDLALLIAAGYSLENVTPFDLFPQTYHVECIALLKRMKEMKDL